MVTEFQPILSLPNCTPFEQKIHNNLVRSEHMYVSTSIDKMGLETISSVYMRSFLGMNTDQITIYLYSPITDRISFMHLEYRHEGFLYIKDVQSKVLRRGFGTILFHQMEKLINHINKAIDIWNQLQVDSGSNARFNPVSYVTGRLDPGSEIDIDNLIEFYIRLGCTVNDDDILHKKLI